MAIQLFSATRKKVDWAEDLEEARDLALMYVNDPRDTIEVLYLFDVEYQQFRGWVTKGDTPRKRARRRRA
jgi:hypothetical protein